MRHADTGWSHYADRFEVLTPDGTVLATRVLRHPHVQEQPVTRSLAGVRIPDDITRVKVRARDSQHGLGGAEVEVPVERKPPARTDSAQATAPLARSARISASP